MSDTDLHSLLLLDDDVITELRDIMEEEFAELLQTFISDLPVQVAHMQTAVAQGNAEQLYQVAHKLKSSCGSLGALQLTELIRRLEQAGRQKTLDDSPAVLREVERIAGQTVASLQAELD